MSYVIVGDVIGSDVIGSQVMKDEFKTFLKPNIDQNRRSQSQSQRFHSGSGSTQLQSLQNNRFGLLHGIILLLVHEIHQDDRNPSLKIKRSSRNESKPLSCLNANRSRLVSARRHVIENVNCHLKK